MLIQYLKLYQQSGVEAFNKVINKNLKKVLVGELNNNMEYVNIFKSFPFRLSNTLEGFINEAEAFSNGYEGKVVTNNGYEMAILENGKVALLPRSSSKINENQIKNFDVELEGRNNGDTEKVVAEMFSEILDW